MEWKRVRLGDYISIKSGLAYKGSKIGKGNSVLLGMGCVSFKDKFVESGARPYDGSDCDERFLVEPGDIVLATRQQSNNLPILAMPAIIPNSLEGKRVIFGTNLYKVENHSVISSKFLFWLMKHQHYVNYIAGVKSGTAVQMVTKKNVEDYKFMCPPLEVRNKISDILWTYDSLIENNTKRICVLEKMAESLYKEWFVRFRFPGHENVEIENGLPKGWNIIKVKDLSVVKSGFAFKSDWFIDTGCGVAKIKDIGGVLMDTSDLSYVDESNCVKAKKFILKEGDLTIALTGATIGKISIVPKHCGLIYTNQRLGKFFNGGNPIEHIPFLYCMFAQDMMVQNIMNLANSSSAQPNISPEQIGNIKFKGNVDLIKRFNKVAEGLFKEMLSLHEMNQNLARQRDLLLPRLMSGKLEI